MNPVEIVRTLTRPRPAQEIAVVRGNGARNLITLTLVSDQIELDPSEASVLARALFDAAMAVTDYRVASEYGQAGTDG